MIAGRAIESLPTSEIISTYCKELPFEVIFGNKTSKNLPTKI